MRIFELLVLVVSLTQSCSGFILKDGYVLTASHCPREGTANGKEILFVKADEAKDILLLKADVKGKISFANAKLGEEVFVAGHFMDLKLLTKGHVSALSGDYIILDLTTFKGESGSAVYNRSGKVVGMVVGGLTDGQMFLTVAVSSKTLKEFLK